MVTPMWIMDQRITAVGRKSHAAFARICAPVSDHRPSGVVSTLPRVAYNPVERCWGILERDFHGSLLDSVDAVIQFAKTMTWKGNHPIVEMVTTTSSDWGEADEGSHA